ncbi:MAG: hypothetical protein JF625_22945 [Inquilinus limosus]|uniref:Uncharacterized protein n=1 Tax=Inquilinus limosus TaxID=171674 RepID=A0A952KFS9_9PROT|nr:hypothetical protein [Inquilinus limosus]
MPKLLRLIAIVEGLAGVVLLFAGWFGEDRSFLLGLLLLVSALISAAVFLALAEILENSELMRAEIRSMRDELRREPKALREGGSVPGRPAPAPPPPRPSTSPIRQSTDPVTGRVTHIYNGVSYDSRLAALAQLTEDERRGQRPPASG